MIVVDTNIIGYLYLTSEHSSQAERVYIKDPNWAAPVLWRSELRNVLVLYARKKILSLSECLQIMENASQVMNGREYEVTSASMISLAVGSKCSANDCEFVSLAKDLGVPLVTVDKQILSHFPETAIALESFI